MQCSMNFLRYGRGLTVRTGHKTDLLVSTRGDAVLPGAEFSQNPAR